MHHLMATLKYLCIVESFNTGDMGVNQRSGAWFTSFSLWLICGIHMLSPPCFRVEIRCFLSCYMNLKDLSLVKVQCLISWKCLFYSRQRDPSGPSHTCSCNSRQFQWNQWHIRERRKYSSCGKDNSASSAFHLFVLITKTSSNLL